MHLNLTWPLGPPDSVLPSSESLLDALAAQPSGCRTALDRAAVKPLKAFRLGAGRSTDIHIECSAEACLCGLFIECTLTSRPRAGSCLGRELKAQRLFPRVVGNSQAAAPATMADAAAVCLCPWERCPPETPSPPQARCSTCRPDA